ncbi:hypothetical protein PVAP13_2NG625150 [Panicum virgatum]|uniref:Uncharacterized protein n=1 Tax=Panicum virgatum TaxID=38727 RepID=A0A8T0W2S0_PANVG|nr:hypothetical protein PVAP13_2NG625150 [Panicum virgatum]KAG2638933.1 hypothetical protein PVAP13_2NG625150 [Panicum virgatum]
MSLTLLAQLLPIPAHCSSTSSTAGSSKQDPASIVACTSTTSAHPLPTPAPGSILSSRSVPCKKFHTTMEPHNMRQCIWQGQITTKWDVGNSHLKRINYISG